MSQLPLLAFEHGRSQHGQITADQLLALGVSAHRRRKLAVAGVLIEAHPGVYRFANAGETLESRCAAACLADTGVVISGPTAARLLGLRRIKGDDIHAMVFRRLVRLDGVVVYRTNQLHPEYDVVRRPDGIRLLATPRLVFDLARLLDDDDFESVLEQLLDRHDTNIPRLFAVGRRLRKSGRDGSARFGRVLQSRPAWTKPKGSHHEVTLLKALARCGINLVPQFQFVLPGGQRIHFDGADPSRRFAIEVDHVTWHGGRVDSQYDKWRDRQVTRCGWQVSRVTDEDIDRRLASTVDELVEIFEGRPVA